MSGREEVAALAEIGVREQWPLDEWVAALLPVIERANVEAWDDAVQAVAWAQDHGPDPLRYVAEHNPYRALSAAQDPAAGGAEGQEPRSEAAHGPLGDEQGEDGESEGRKGSGAQAGAEGVVVHDQRWTTTADGHVIDYVCSCGSTDPGHLRRDDA